MGNGPGTNNNRKRAGTERARAMGKEYPLIDDDIDCISPVLQGFRGRREGLVDKTRDALNVLFEDDTLSDGPRVVGVINELRDAVSAHALGPFYELKSHNEFLRWLLELAVKHIHGDRDFEGARYRVYKGQRGIGKSYVMRLATCMLQVLYPGKVMVFYLDNCNNLDICSSFEEQLQLFLTERFPEIDFPNALPTDLKKRTRALMNFLADKDIRAVVFLDEFQNLYKSTEDKFAPSYTFLETISMQKDNNLSILCSGSSSVIDRLVTGKAAETAAIATAFPRVSQAQNLNSSKFKTRPIRLDSPTDQQALSVMISAFCDIKTEINVELFRQTMYWGGTNVRKVRDILKNAEPPLPVQFCDEAQSIQFKGLDKVFPKVMDILAFAEGNKDLSAAARQHFGDGNLAAAAASVEWENWVPVQRVAVVESLRAWLANDDIRENPDFDLPKDLFALLDLMGDKGWLTIDHEGGVAGKVYPVNFHTLAATVYGAEESFLKARAPTAFDYFRKHIKFHVNVAAKVPYTDIGVTAGLSHS